VRAAVCIMNQLDFRNDSCGWQPVETGIGLNTGKTIMGVVGTETRMEPTVLGDAVNLASRTEALCKKYGARILITENTLEAMLSAAQEFTMRLVDNVTVKGKSKPCKIYEVINGDTPKVRKEKETILKPFHDGMEYFAQARFQEALEKFRQCVRLRPADTPSLLYVHRCEELLNGHHDITNWDGVYHLVDK